MADRLSYTVPEAAAACGIGTSTLWQHIKDGLVPVVKLGGRTLVRHIDLETVLSKHLVSA